MSKEQDAFNLVVRTLTSNGQQVGKVVSETDGGDEALDLIRQALEDLELYKESFFIATEKTGKRKSIINQARKELNK